MATTSNVSNENVVAELISKDEDMFDFLAVSKFRYKSRRIIYSEIYNKYQTIPSISINHSEYEIKFSLSIIYDQLINKITIILKLLQSTHLNDIEIYARCKAHIGNLKHLCINKKWTRKDLNISYDVQFEEVKNSFDANTFLSYQCLDLVLKVQVIEKEKASIFKVSDDLDALFKSGDKSDITFTFDNEKEIKAHQLILTTRNQVFANMIKKYALQEDSSVIKIEHINSDIFEILLHFIYSGKEATIDDKRIGELLIAAETYEVDELISICESKIIKNLNIDNAADRLIIADSAKTDVLKAAITNFIYMNKQVLNSVGYKNLEKTHPRLARDVIRKFKLTKLFAEILVPVK